MLMKENDIHPSILEVLNDEIFTPQPTELTDDNGEKDIVHRFTFGDHEPTLLEAIKAIIGLSENSGLSNEFIFEAEEALNYVSLRLDISSTQALLLALLVNNFTDQHIDVTEEDERPQRGVMNHRDITERQLFYDEATNRQIDELSGLLDDEHYQLIYQRLQEKGFRCGFTCLFYGSPGTGKTETVLQLARRTHRNIMQVNVSEIKSKWVGDSEKNTKALFDDYRRLVKDSKLTPILLFNEADAIINRRQENAERGVDKMENSIQNIILQEMETLDGILIATTNLEQNMDRAFERRFLYKIQFQKPTAEARRHIWHELIPSLSDDAISQLASRYDFSGGQIENIARHHAIDSILHSPDADDLSTLISHCDQERLEKQRPKIGF